MANELIELLWSRIRAQQGINFSQLYSPQDDIMPVTDPDYPSVRYEWASGAYFPSDAWGALWNEPSKLNLQGSNYQIWVPGAGPSGGSWNKLNGNSSIQNGRVSVHTTSNFVTLHMQHFGYADAIVRVNGKKLAHKPLVSAINGEAFLIMRWPDNSPREISFVLPPAIFVQIMHQRSHIVRPAPPRFNLGVTGDSYGENGYQDNPSTFQTYNILAAIEEFAGVVCTQYNQGGTGYTNPGGGDGTNSVVGSAARLALITNNTDLDGLLCIGSINDGAATPAAVSAAAVAFWDAVRIAKGPTFPIWVAGPQPYMRNNGGNVNNNLALKAAALAHPSVVGYIDWYGATQADAWWDGTGSQQTPGGPDDKQTELLGPDGIHPKWLGAKYMGKRFAEEMGKANIAVTDRILERTVNR